MRVTVSTTGGVFNDHRVLSINNRELKVTERGKLQSNRRLAPADADHVSDLAATVAGLELPAPAPPKAAVDGGTTTIEIAEDVTDDDTDGRLHRRIVMSAGDDAPEPIWALLDTVEALAIQTDPADPT
jgi:hypothetical protein